MRELVRESHIGKIRIPEIGIRKHKGQEVIKDVSQEKKS